MKLDDIIEEIILFFILIIAYPVMLFNRQQKNDIKRNRH